MTGIIVLREIDPIAVRGYLSASGWKDHRATQTGHDENITHEQATRLVGADFDEVG
jgi:hypothetical protein